MQDIIAASDYTIASAHRVVYGTYRGHAWPQNSTITTIPGKSSDTIVFGAHLDSIDRYDPMNGRTPDADDDGSRTVALLEVLRALLADEKVRNGKWRVRLICIGTLSESRFTRELGGVLGVARRREECEGDSVGGFGGRY